MHTSRPFLTVLWSQRGDNVCNSKAQVASRLIGQLCGSLACSTCTVTVFLLPLNCVVGNIEGESPAQLLHVFGEQILSALSFLPGKLGHSGVGVSLVMVHLSSVELILMPVLRVRGPEWWQL